MHRKSFPNCNHYNLCKRKTIRKAFRNKLCPVCGITTVDFKSHVDINFYNLLTREEWRLLLDQSKL